LNIVLIGMKSKRPAKSRGRPRAFDAERALDQAMRIFWKHGYEGASLQQLTGAMEINRPSMYAVFGNKEALFRKALDRYVQQSGCLLRDALAQPTARATVQWLLRGTVDQGARGKIRGCMLVQGALACGESADPIRLELAARRASFEKALRRRFERGISDGDLPRSADAAVLAKFVATFQHGLSVQLAGGASREKLLAAVEMALSIFPA
jgi:AcrR family transcriptional regulator